jgi:hypothetical protein
MRDTEEVPDLGFVPEEDREFINAISREMEAAGYGSDIGPGYCWGKYMITFRKKNLKNPKNAARIYLRENGIVLRFFLSDIDAHREYIERAPNIIREPFVNDFGNCRHCHNENNGACNFRRSWTLFGIRHEKCSDSTIQYFSPSIEHVGEYMDLFREFNCRNRKREKKFDA